MNGSDVVDQLTNFPQQANRWRETTFAKGGAQLQPIGAPSDGGHGRVVRIDADLQECGGCGGHGALNRVLYDGATDKPPTFSYVLLVLFCYSVDNSHVASSVDYEECLN